MREVEIEQAPQSSVAVTVVNDSNRNSNRTDHGDHLLPPTRIKTGLLALVWSAAILCSAVFVNSCLVLMKVSEAQHLSERFTTEYYTGIYSICVFVNLFVGGWLLCLARMDRAETAQDASSTRCLARPGFEVGTMLFNGGCAIILRSIATDRADAAASVVIDQGKFLGLIILEVTELVTAVAVLLLIERYGSLKTSRGKELYAFHLVMAALVVDQLLLLLMDFSLTATGHLETRRNDPANMTFIQLDEQDDLMSSAAAMDALSLGFFTVLRLSVMRWVYLRVWVQIHPDEESRALEMIEQLEQLRTRVAALEAGSGNAKERKWEQQPQQQPRRFSEPSRDATDSQSV